MRVLLASAAGFIAFSLADTALFDGRIVPAAIKVTRAIAASFGFDF